MKNKIQNVFSNVEVDLIQITDEGVTSLDEKRF